MTATLELLFRELPRQLFQGEDGVVFYPYGLLATFCH
nr:MAG TPA: hypothetical protein [Caudoviricetes sp.]